MRKRHWSPSISELGLDGALAIDQIEQGNLYWLGSLVYLSQKLRETVGPDDETDPLLRIPIKHHHELIELYQFWKEEGPRTVEDLRIALCEVVEFLLTVYQRNYNRKVDGVGLERCGKLCLQIHNIWFHHGRRRPYFFAA